MIYLRQNFVNICQAKLANNSTEPLKMDFEFPYTGLSNKTSARVRDIARPRKTQNRIYDVCVELATFYWTRLFI